MQLGIEVFERNEKVYTEIVPDCSWLPATMLDSNRESLTPFVQQGPLKLQNAVASVVQYYSAFYSAAIAANALR